MLTEGGKRYRVTYDGEKKFSEGAVPLTKVAAAAAADAVASVRGPARPARFWGSEPAGCRLGCFSLWVS